MFVQYNAISYPVTIVMNETLAKEYIGKSSYKFTVKSMHELEDLVNDVINMNEMIEFIQSLINESLRQELINNDSE